MSYKDSFTKEVKDASICGVSFLTFFVVLIVGLSGLGYLGYRILAPAYEQVRYDTFKNSQTYNDGMIRDLVDLQREYIKSNPEQQEALKAIIRHRFSIYDMNRLPPDLQQFYLSVK